MSEVSNEREQQQQSTNVAYVPDLLPDMLPVYYKRLFPHISFYRWLSYANVRDVSTCRGFSFTLHDDIYLRYLSFALAIHTKLTLALL